MKSFLIFREIGLEISPEWTHIKYQILFWFKMGNKLCKRFLLNSYSGVIKVNYSNKVIIILYVPLLKNQILSPKPDNAYNLLPILQSIYI